MAQATDKNTTPTTTDDRASFDDKMCDLTTATKLLIAHLDRLFDVGLELPMKEGADVMNECMAAQWIAKRIDEDAHTVWNEFDGSRSDRGSVEFAEAAE